MVNYNNLVGDAESQKFGDKVTIWIPFVPMMRAAKVARPEDKSCACSKSRVCILLLALSLLTFGVLFVPLYFAKTRTAIVVKDLFKEEKPELEPRIRGVFVNNSFSSVNTTENGSVTFVHNITQYTAAEVGRQPQILVSDDIFWSDYVESLLPEGFTQGQAHDWSKYVRMSVAIKLEHGCGRMQNRLVTFADGRRACVRYRQNTDQIQGEIFSFYLAQILNLRNLVPSAISIVDTSSTLWSHLSNEIASAQWRSQRPVVLTQYVPNLDVGDIPKLVRPAERRHLNRLEVEVSPFSESAQNIVELAQWSDLIIFDYLTANLDRVVNNLYNYQWNSNIMEAPAHNLAKEANTDLLVFLDNESGLLHGYRLLEKYEVYHGLLLDNLCLFRRSTAEMIGRLRRDGNIGDLLNDMFDGRNTDRIKDVLPTLPERSVKILNGRIRRVYEQIVKCQTLFKREGD